MAGWRPDILALNAFADGNNENYPSFKGFEILVTYMQVFILKLTPSAFLWLYIQGIPFIC